MRQFAGVRLVLIPIVVFAWLGVSYFSQSPGAAVITNAKSADGTCKPLRKGSVRISGDRITQVGNFEQITTPKA